MSNSDNVLVFPAPVAERQSAFAGEWQATEPRLKALIRACVRRADERDDIQQDIALEAWKSYGTLHAAQSFWPWLKAIAAVHIGRYTERLNRIEAHEVHTDALDNASGAL